ncbi:MAG: hypothetical protein ACRC0Y_08290 [Fusobacteriaceae bacterium]
MLKKVTIITMIFSTLVLGKINDYRGTFSDENKEKLKISIDGFEKETGKKIYLNTLEDNEGFESEEQEKTIVLNLIKNKEQKDDILKVQIKISQDLNPEDMSSDLSLLLENVKEFINEKDESLLAVNLIDGLKEVFITASDSEQENEETVQLTLSNKVFLGILLTMFLLYIRILQIKRKKKKYKFSKR